MNHKIEVVITVWEDKVFKIRDKIESDDTHSIREQFEFVMNNIEEKLAELDKKKYAIGNDDEIPF